MNLVISHDGVEGTVKYDSLGKEVWVAHPDPTVRKVAHHIFNSVREYSGATKEKSPNIIGDDVKILGRAIESKDFMLQCASELRAHTGIKVHWEHDKTSIV